MWGRRLLTRCCAAAAWKTSPAPANNGSTSSRIPTMLRQGGNINWLWLTAAVIAGDQISKQLILRGLQPFEVRPLLPHFNLVAMHNTGAAFSMFNTAPAVVFVALSVGVSIAIMLWL